MSEWEYWEYWKYASLSFCLCTVPSRFTKCFSYPLFHFLLMSTCEVYHAACPLMGWGALMSWVNVPKSHRPKVLSQDVNLSVLPPVFLLPIAPASYTRDCHAVLCNVGRWGLFTPWVLCPVLVTGRCDTRIDGVGGLLLDRLNMAGLLSGKGFAPSPQSQEGANIPFTI